MEALKDWVKELVILVMLAGSLELLIPASGMKKYVRTTMGLLVVLSVAKPIVSLLGSPISVLETERLVGGPRAVPAAGVPSLGQVMDQAQRFRERNQAMAREQGRTALESAARSAVLRVEGVRAAAVTVELDPGTGEVARVGVAITPGRRAGTQGSVPPVRPVGSDGPAPAPAISPELGQAVRHAVAAALGLEPNDVRVQVYGQQEPVNGIGGSRP